MYQTVQCIFSARDNFYICAALIENYVHLPWRTYMWIKLCFLNILLYVFLQTLIINQSIWHQTNIFLDSSNRRTILIGVGSYGICIPNLCIFLILISQWLSEKTLLNNITITDCHAKCLDPDMISGVKFNYTWCFFINFLAKHYHINFQDYQCLFHLETEYLKFLSY